MEPIERYRGCLLGLAAGDALGTTLEFQKPGTFTPITDMVGGGPFDLPAGYWTDDTSLALCLAESLIEKGDFDAQDQMERYLRWYWDGHLSSTGECFDIGLTTRYSLKEFERTGEPFCGPTDPNTAGNGSIMRLAPIPMAYATQPEEAIKRAALSSQTTHGAQTSVDACRYLAGLIVGALNGASKDELLSPFYCPISGYWDENPLHEEIAELAAGSFKQKEPPDIIGTGFVARSLEAALWAFHKGDNFEASCLLAANLGNDADTTAAVCGQLAGAYYGENHIPKNWLDKLAFRDMLVSFAEKLFDFSR
ncbi:MAG: ADP-ribosylglycohydrolase family protein [Anaerolineales bacterium]|nr:ADP-ribosylglycohydrolase family protein [Anaerolineales bacterium]